MKRKFYRLCQATLLKMQSVAEKLEVSKAVIYQHPLYCMRQSLLHASVPEKHTALKPLIKECLNELSKPSTFTCFLPKDQAPIQSVGICKLMLYGLESNGEVLALVL